jgi:hypothetical protein
MITRFKTVALALAGAILAGPLVTAAPAEAGHRDRWGVERHVVVHRTIYDRPVAYRPRPAYRRVVIVERGFHPGRGYGWRRHHPGWHDRPRCWLPERHLCR